MLTGESQRKNPQTAFQLNVPGFEEYPFFYMALPSLPAFMGVWT